MASSVKVPLRAVKHHLKALSLRASRGCCRGCTEKIPGYPLDHSRQGFADGSFSRGTFEINNWVMGLLKKGAVCPVSLLSWCAFVPRECMVVVWCPPHPCSVMPCGRTHNVTWTSGYSSAQNLYGLPEEAEC